MIGICGAGAIGRLWAYRLGPAHCTFLTTREQQPKKTNNSIEFEVIQDQQHSEQRPRLLIPLQHAANQSLSKKLKAVLICTKSYHAPEAATALDTRLPKSIPFVLFQNGLGSQNQIVEHINARPIYAATTTSGANINNAGQLVLAGDGDTLIGALNKLANSEAGLELTESLNIDRNNAASYTANIEELLWRKLLINCGINAFTALENVSNGDIRDTRTFQELWARAVSELCHLAPKAGFPPSSDKIGSLILEVTTNTKNNISSMLQDVRAGRQTEIDDINGYAAKVIEQLGHEAPANRELTRRVHALRD